MASPLDDVSYLARSEQRVQVLDLLADGPRTRTDLQEATEYARVTIGRTLGGFEDRGWVRRDGDAYRLTPLGTLVAEDLARLLDTAAAAGKLRDVLEWLPAEEIDVDLRRFADARFTFSTRTDPTSPVRRYANAMADADRVRILSFTAKPTALRVHHDAVRESGQTFEIVHTPSAFEAITADPEMADWLRELMASEQGSYYRYDGDVPFNLMIADGTAYLLLTAADGTRPALVECDDDAVHSWAVSTFERYRGDATLVDVSSFDDAVSAVPDDGR